ncbi:multiheme c-type cytochrome [Amantichitinum ursilacus]|uniref:Cytochrome c552 n=1 Tax=Amantichitinum ursilacus TaxID=857265 RepID=A0A0N0XLC3_9NEIS|nr:multiheme c-type cytochrome [Amantichitinum ursilacus]KPC55353.1 Cytochrome c552 [Amantichitinum ursilacus]
MGKSSRRKAQRADAPVANAPLESTDTSATPAPPAAAGKARWWLWLLAALVLAALAGFWVHQFRSQDSGPAAAMPTSALHAQFVDEQKCVACHSAQFGQWKDSHHAQAMKVASAQTVLGNFDNATFDYNGVTTRFYKKGAEFRVQTDGPDGKPGDFKVIHTFGLAPLQQYLIEMPGGRMQALGIAWNVDKKQWFHLYPHDKLTAADELHWTRPAQNANFMCVECHVTNMKRNYSAVDDSFKSTWNSLGVGCQACHGPASNHLAWAAKTPHETVKGAGFDVPLKNAPQTTVLETCARCHARRAPLDDGFNHKNRLADDYSMSLLTAQLYEVDGHFKAEDFESGSFAQSKMFMKGVTCVDCHNPHTGELRAQGNAVCLQCHNASGPIQRPGLDTSTLQRKDYDTPEHTHHPKGSPGATCVACHMPGKFYMEIDFRHDHALTIPRPDLSRELGTPNACNECHKDKTPEWAAKQIESWFGKQTHPPSFGEMMSSLRHGKIGAADVLNTLVLDPTIPPLRRATALEEAARYPGNATTRVVTLALKDADPLVRSAAVDASGMWPPEARQPLLTPLLTDPVRQVRISVARQLVDVRDQLGAARPQWDKAIAEYRAVQNALAERAEAQTNLASLDRDLGQHDAAQQALARALKLNPDFLPAITLQADYLSAAGQDQQSVAVLQSALAKHTDSGLLYHALGLAQIRAGDRVGALVSLKTAWQKSPDDALYGFVYAVALHDTGDVKGAIRQLDAVMQKHPEHRDSAMTAVRYRIEANDTVGAQAIAQHWLEINPGEPSLARTGKASAPAQGG